MVITGGGRDCSIDQLMTNTEEKITITQGQGSGWTYVFNYIKVITQNRKPSQSAVSLWLQITSHSQSRNYMDGLSGVHGLKHFSFVDDEITKKYTT